MTEWILELVRGWFSPYTYAENEVELVSSKSDPPALRMAVDQSQVEHNLGKLSMNTRRGVSGVHDEHALVQGQLHGVVGGNARTGFGAVEIGTRGPGEEAVTQRMLVAHDRVEFLVPIVAPNLGEGGGSGSLPASNELRAPGGVYWLVIQDDGNIVAYANRVPFDYSTGRAYWTTGTVNP